MFRPNDDPAAKKRDGRAKERAAKRRAKYRRQHSAASSRADSQAARDIGPIPEVADKARRTRRLKTLRAFTDYFPDRFVLTFSPDHEKFFAQANEIIHNGGIYWQALPRGSGKTTLTEVACLYALLCGKHEFLALVGADKEAAVDLLDSIKCELETNDHLLADFPEVCYPIRQLEGIAHRCKGQTTGGKRTHIGWTSTRITLPTIEGSAASGATVRCFGITGRIRGAKHTTASGRSVRPTLALVDDPQTDESAHSPSQCSTRERIIKSAIMGLAGPGRKIALLGNGTIIASGDLSERLSDRKQNPEFHGVRGQLLYAFPTRMDLWEKYHEKRVVALQNDRPPDEANTYYRRNRKKMDDGARPAWKERKHEDELSATQHAMNLYLSDPVGFAAEYQNQPVNDNVADEDILDASEIAQRINGYREAEVPSDAAWLTAFVDVQKQMLYYTVIAVARDFTSYVIEYGSFPRQPLVYYTLASANRTLSDEYPKAGLEGRIYQGLKALIDDYLLRKEFARGDGAAMRVARCLIDANWEASTKTVYSFCRQSAAAAILLPSHGRYVGAASKPMNDYTQKPGDHVGNNWRAPALKEGRRIRYVIYDTNYWKTFAHARLAQVPGDRGSMTLFKASVARHQMFADHMTAEYAIRTEGRGRTVHEWKQPPNRPDNHLLDCTAGALVAASIAGASLEVHTERRGRRRKKPRITSL